MVAKYRALISRPNKHLQTEDAQLVTSYSGLYLSNYYAKRSGTKKFQHKDIRVFLDGYNWTNICTKAISRVELIMKKFTTKMVHYKE